MIWIVLIFFMPYIYLLLKIYLSLRNIKPYKLTSRSENFISVIIPCRNEEKNLPSLLSDIADQEYNQDHFELIIVDDNSDDSTFKTASEFRGIKKIKVLKNSSSGKKMAVYTGIKAADGDLIITTDADCRIGPAWLKTIASCRMQDKPEFIIGPVDLIRGKGFFQKFQELEFLGLQGITAGTAAAGNPLMCNGANMAFTKKTYKDNSEYLHPELVSGDDIFLLHSIKKNKEQSIIWLESGDALVSTSVSRTLKGFLKQRSRWISKAGSYSDSGTSLLAIVTFVTILLQVFCFAAGFIKPVFFLVFASALVLKSIPDYLILKNRAMFYKKKSHLWFFLPGEVIYPLYVLAVIIFYLFTRSEYLQHQP